MPQLFMSPVGFPKEGQPAFVLEHASPSAEPRPSTPSSVCPSRSARIEGGEEQKVPPSASKFRRLSRSAQLRPTEREREQSPSHGRWTPKNFHFAFMQLSQSVRLFGYCSPTHSVGARAGAVLCGNFAPFCNRVSGGWKRLLPLPSPSQMLEQSGELMGQLCLARSIPFASRMASAQYVRSHPIPSDLQLRFGRSGDFSLSLSPSRDMSCFYGDNIYAWKCAWQERKRERGQWGAIVLQNEEAPAQTNGESQYSGRICWSRKWERKTVREGDGVCLGALLILNDNTRHMQMKQPGRPRRRRSRS